MASEGTFAERLHIDLTIERAENLTAKMESALPAVRASVEKR
jgi:hypothetical protein